MELQIQGRNVEISDDIRAYVTRKIERTERRLNLPMEAHVVISHENTRSQLHRMVMEATLTCAGAVLRGEERAASVKVAVDALSDTLDRRVAQFKSRLYRSEAARRHGGVGSIREMESAVRESSEGSDGEPEEDLTLGRVVRTKSFSMKPMAVDEAATQMELLGHTFFFFLNGDSGAANVLYRRWDGDYGLIEPSVASHAP